MEVLPPEILRRQVCSECSNYLTVMPITQMKTGEILCGRPSCFKKSVILNDGVKSLLNTIMESFQFPCVNYLEGCSERLNSETSEEHEKQCKYELHECFFCSDKGNWGQIVHHVTREHPSNVTNNLKFCFEIGAESSQEFVYLNDDIYFISVNVTNEKLAVVIKSVNPSISHIKPKRNISTIKFWPYMLNEDHKEAVIDHIDLFNNYGCSSYFEKQMKDLVVFFKLRTMLSCQFYLNRVDLSKRELEVGIKNAWLTEKVHKLSQEIEEIKTLAKVETNILSATLDENKKTIQIERRIIEELSNVIKQTLPYMFRCNKCKTIVEDVLFICENRHSYCEKCVVKVDEIDYCDDCSSTNKKFMGFNRIAKLSTLNFNCDWAGCNQVTTMANFLNHKSTCSQRIIPCPVLDCYTSFKTMQALKEHWHSQIPLKSANYVLINKHGYYSWYWLLDTNKLYFVDVKYLETSVTINSNPIQYYDVLSEQQEFEIAGIYDKKYYFFNSPTQERTTNGRFIFSANDLKYGQSQSDFSGLRIRLITK